MVPDKVFHEALTPSYIFDLGALKARAAMLRERLGARVHLVYAMKANPFLVEALVPCVDGFEVCSPGEERICLRCGVPGEKMVLSGVNKEEADVRDYVSHYGPAALYTVESPLQMERLNAEAERQKITLRVLLRLNAGNQFGMDAQTVRTLLEKRADYPALSIFGLQYFSGTQKKLKRILEEIDELDDFLEETGLEELEFGPGLPVSYFTEDKGPGEEALLSALVEKLQSMRFAGGITLEMGRFLAAPCGYYLTNIRDLKKGADASYCIVDGGIHQVNYYGQMMGMKHPFMRLMRAGQERPEPLTGEAEEGSEHWTVCGSLCTTADILLRDLPVKELQLSDTFLFEGAGAYAMTEGISLFLSRDLPRIYVYDDGQLKLVRDKIYTEEWNCGKTD